MIINYAINSSDDSQYLDYWEVIKSAWLKLNITPVLVKVSKEFVENGIVNNQDHVLICLKELPDIKSSLQAQISRLWAFKLLNGNCIISDIDMMPLSSNYFNGTSLKYSEDEIVSYCSDAAERFDGYHPMCYVLANSEVFSKLITHNSWEEFCTDLAEKGGQGWSTDQWHLTNLIKDYPKLISLKRGFNSAGCADNRLDRLDWRYNESDIKNDMLFDAHLLRPYKENKNEIDKLLKLIP